MDHSDLIQRQTSIWAEEYSDVDVEAVRIVLTLVWAGRNIEARLNDIARLHGLGVRGDYETLVLLYHGAERALSPVDVAEALSISTSAVTGRLDRLERAGLLERHADSRDRRVIKLSITDRGREMVRSVFRASQAAQSDMVAALDPNQRRAIGETLAALLRSLEQ
ncbi:MAG: MarR family transcriptional regulator [bacterium]